MKKGIKIGIAIVCAVLIALVLWFLLGSVSPFESIRKAHNQPKALVSLQQQAPEIADEMHITAHRGVNALAPENTLPAYEKAIELGYYSAECDIKQTADGRWVLYHDPLLYTRFLKTGTVGGKDFKTLRSFEYKTGTDFWNCSGLQIPTLEEYLDLFVGTETRPQIEIKTSRYDSLSTVIDAVKERGLEKTAIIISFDLEQLKEIRKYDNEIELWYLVYKINQTKIDEAKALGNCWLSADAGVNNKKTISMCLEQDVGLSLWTINKVQKAEELHALGVRYIETDILY